MPPETQVVSLDNVMQQRRQQQAEQQQRRQQQRIQTRTGRFRERWGQVFGRELSLESLGAQIRAKGDEAASQAWAEFEYQGKRHRVDFRRDEHGIGFYMDDERLLSLTGRNHAGNTDIVLEKLAGDVGSQLQTVDFNRESE
jgi:hypothetical protein